MFVVDSMLMYELLDGWRVLGGSAAFWSSEMNTDRLVTLDPFDNDQTCRKFLQSGFRSKKLKRFYNSQVLNVKTIS